MNYQWYPGHMTKARRMMQENIRLIDLVIELVDARIPCASRNPDIDELGKGRARLILLNKADLADESASRAWMRRFARQGITAVEMDARSRAGIRSMQAAVQQVCQEKLERDRKRGIQNRPVRAMVAGIPNVGKSTFINSFAGKACAKTGNKPGVTRGRQWIRLNRSLELLDTPGILWPKLEEERVGLHLALIGSMNDEILQLEELACELLAILPARYPGRLAERYQVEESGSAPLLLEAIARARGCVKKGGQADLSRGASLLLDDFRSGRLGRITLELPPEAEETPQKENGKDEP